VPALQPLLLAGSALIRAGWYQPAFPIWLAFGEAIAAERDLQVNSDWFSRRLPRDGR
jgi:hypothetical protein